MAEGEGLRDTQEFPRPGLGRTAAAATAATVAAYGVTLLQQILYARRLGVGSDTDALAAALAWAIASSGLIGTTLLSVVLPRYTVSLTRNPNEARRLLQTGAAVGLATGLAFAIATLVGAELIAATLIPLSEAATIAQLSALLRMTAVLHVGWVAVWIGMTLTNARERYVLAALAPVASAAPVVAVLLLSPRPTVEQVAVAYSVGVLSQVLLVVGAMRSASRDGLPILALSALRALWRPMLGVGAAFLVLNMVGLLVRALASAHASGDVAVVDYATRLTTAVEQLVLGGILAVLLTRWSRDAANEHPGAALGRSLPLAIDLAVAIGVLFAVFGTDLVTFLFGSIRFDDAAVSSLGLLLAWMAPGIAGHMVVLVVIRALLAAGRSLALFWMSALVAGLIAVAGVALVGAGLIGVGAAYSLAWVAGATVSVLMTAPRIALLSVAGELVRCGIACGLAGLGATVVVHAVGAPAIVRLIIGGIAFAVIAAPLATALRLAAATVVISRRGRFRADDASGRAGR